jgi:siroheme synthase (precorrin-2 oxidase/ferrochelatase)
MESPAQSKEHRVHGNDLCFSPDLLTGLSAGPLRLPIVLIFTSCVDERENRTLFTDARPSRMLHNESHNIICFVDRVIALFCVKLR